MAKRKTKEFKISDLKKDKDGKYVFPLLKPFKFGDTEYTQLLLDEPKAKHMRGLPGDPGMDDILKIVADLAGEADAVIDEMGLTDANNAAEFFGSFE